MQDNLDTPKWKTENIEMEAPLPLMVNAAEPAAVIAYYHKYMIYNGRRNIWISYRMSANGEYRRVCIYAEVDIRRFITQTLTFKYIIYKIRVDETCDNPDKNRFVDKNVQNGYKSDWKGIDATSAFTSSGLAYTLNVYISGFTVENESVTHIINVNSNNQNHATPNPNPSLNPNLNPNPTTNPNLTPNPNHNPTPNPTANLYPNQNLHQQNIDLNNHEQGNAPGPNSNVNTIRDNIN